MTLTALLTRQESKAVRVNLSILTKRIKIYDMDNKLEQYNQKRDFQKTSEPLGVAGASGQALKYVVQRHMARREHYDFRLEWQGALMSWAVPKGPSFNPQQKRLAVKVEDHPLDYRNFEGVIPKGQYGGGTVMIWDEGEWLPSSDVGQALEKGTLKFYLDGERLRGGWALIRLTPKEGENKDNWILLKEKDEYAKDHDGLDGFAVSVRTERTMEEIERNAQKEMPKNPFDAAEVQLAKMVNKAPDGGEWLFEPKYDGYRILAFVEGGSARLVTRNGKDYTHHFKEIARSLEGFAQTRPMVLDGEMTVIGQDGNADFHALQNYIKNPKKGKLTYMVFDLLALDAQDLRGLELIERKQKLESLLENAPQNIVYSQHVAGGGPQCFAAACQAGMEGIVGKKAHSAYKGQRNSDWIKVKCDNRQEFVIGGYTLSQKRTSGISSLVLGYYENAELIYCGRAGSGIAQAQMEELERKFQELIIETPPFKDPPKASANEKIIWLKPKLVAQIKFSDWTKDNLLRQASYKGLRQDKNPKDITLEKPDERLLSPIESQEQDQSAQDILRQIKITNPDKVIYDNPHITKGDVILYYAKAASHMLPYVSGRILSVVRCPKGVNGQCFFKKHPVKGSKGIVTAAVENSDGGKEEYFYIKDALGLVAEAQMGTLEFHVWGSRAQTLEQPDMMVFDLDPDQGMDLSAVRQGVMDLKGVLDQLSLKSYLKTSGGKGYHIVVPFTPSAPWDVFNDFAKWVAQLMEKKWPSRYTANMRKANRKGKIFIDWVRNGRGATGIAPYSLRARQGAKVSMPIAWEELYDVAPDGIDMANALIRIESAHDPWQGFFENEQRLR